MRKGAGERQQAYQKANPLKPHQSLQKVVAAFKVQCRRLKTLCVEEGDEQYLATSYKQVKRLKAMGIDNRHAAIDGLPSLSVEDAKMITQAILAMRGSNQKKHKAMHQKGTLQLQKRPMAYKGTATAWMRNLDLGGKEDWLEEPALPDGQACNKKVLKNIACPRCGFLKSVERYKVYGKVGFSRITCMRCRSVTSAEKWRCGCELLWPKCELHMSA